MSRLDVGVYVGGQFVVEVSDVLVTLEREVCCCLSAEFGTWLTDRNSIDFHFALNFETFKTATVRRIICLES